LSASERRRYRSKLSIRDGGFVCFYCKKRLTGDYHIDHKTPIVAGGKHELENFALSCTQCNQEKYNKGLDEYRAWRRLNGLPILF
jgi:5-methylcytosine-specific restriction endonuclease McrA